MLDHASTRLVFEIARKVETLMMKTLAWFDVQTCRFSQRGAAFEFAVFHADFVGLSLVLKREHFIPVGRSFIACIVALPSAAVWIQIKDRLYSARLLITERN